MLVESSDEGTCCGTKAAEGMGHTLKAVVVVGAAMVVGALVVVVTNSVVDAGRVVEGTVVVAIIASAACNNTDGLFGRTLYSGQFAGTMPALLECMSKMISW